MAKTGNVTLAADACGVARATVYNHRSSDPAFARAWDEALDEATDALEAEARRRALEGFEVPVFYKGEECGIIRKYSDGLLMLLLKAYRPGRFKDKPKSEPEKPSRMEIVLLEEGNNETSDQEG